MPDDQQNNSAVAVNHTFELERQRPLQAKKKKKRKQKATPSSSFFWSEVLSFRAVRGPALPLPDLVFHLDH